MALVPARTGGSSLVADSWQFPESFPGQFSGQLSGPFAEQHAGQGAGQRAGHVSDVQAEQARDVQAGEIAHTSCHCQQQPGRQPCQQPGLQLGLQPDLQPDMQPGWLQQELRFPEPIQHEICAAQLERLLLWCVAKRASDIVFCPGDPVWLQRDGVWLPVTDTALTDAETQIIVNESSGQSNRAGMVKTGRSLDYAWAIRIPGQRVLRQRFRVNATSSNKGLYVVMRVLPRSLPRLSDMEGLTAAQKQALFPEAGLVVVSGVMGSGKSTLLAAILHEAARSAGRQILTLEDPVEFDFSSLPLAERRAPVTQSAVHIDVEDWLSGVRTLTRRKGEIVMVGECRDRETIRALLTTVEQGVTAYTTVHAQDVPQTITRMVNAFPEEERLSVAAVLAANVRVL